MKTEEDEAFDDLAKKQGSWGGGFQAKRRMAADKFIAAEEHKVGERYGYVPKLHPSEWMDAQPEQEPASYLYTVLNAYGPDEGISLDQKAWSQLHAAIQAALAQPAQEPVAREWNFCERCGKRTADLTVIHTCTPPQEGA